MNGQKVTEERSVMTTEDPCVTCKCNMGRVTCAKKACPVLHCPKSRTLHKTGECCPYCEGKFWSLKQPSTWITNKLITGSGKYFSPPRGACMLGTSLHSNGTTFYQDECTKCSCKNSAINCSKDTCPVLECAREYQTRLPGRCCPQCPLVEESRAACSYGGKTYGASIIYAMLLPSIFSLLVKHIVYNNPSY